MIDLHMHLNGSLSAEIIISLAKKYNINLPTYDCEELKKMISVPLDCDSLNTYLKCTQLPRLVTQTKASITDAVTMLLEELKNQGFIYAEIRFAPQRHRDNGLSQEEVVLAAIDGLKNTDLKAKLILCCMRGKDLKEQNIETINLAKKYLNDGVGGVDLAGAEALFKTQDYKDIFEYARSLNIPITIHAGEADGPESVRCAIDMGATRIGHGIRSIHDEDLLKRIIEENITLEMCPTSNFQTKSVSNINEYPLRRFLDLGVRITLNTDNKTISSTNLADEYSFAEKELGLKNSERLLLLRNAIAASFTNESEKKALYSLLESRLENSNEFAFK